MALTRASSASDQPTGSLRKELERWLLPISKYIIFHANVRSIYGIILDKTETRQKGTVMWFRKTKNLPFKDTDCAHGPTDMIARCSNCKNWFCYREAGSWQCRECGFSDGDHHLERASHISELASKERMRAGLGWTLDDRN